MLTFGTITAEEASVKMVATRAYRICTVDVNGVQRPAIDFLEGAGWQLIEVDPTIQALVAAVRAEKDA